MVALARSLRRPLLSLALAAALAPAAASAHRVTTPASGGLDPGSCAWSSSGDNTYWPLQPGRRLVLEGREDGKTLRVTITTLDETEVVAGVVTRVVEEREEEGGELSEVSRNFVATCPETGDVAYFGEDVDEYEGGRVVGHGGSWRAGVDGARPGLLMPGRFVVGARYDQEWAPGVAQDRAENRAEGRRVKVPAGTFGGCVEIVETSPLSPRERSTKVYAPGVGLLVDDGVRLVSHQP